MNIWIVKTTGRAFARPELPRSFRGDLLFYTLNLPPQTHSYDTGKTWAL